MEKPAAYFIEYNDGLQATLLMLNGKMIVGRDIAHAKLKERIDSGEGLPQYVKDHPIYSAAKAGDIGFVKALAQEGAKKGITVNAICPGYIGTEMVKAIAPEVLEKAILPHITVGRLGEPEEIAKCVLFLVSDDAGFITGSTISANGGQYMI